MQNADAACGSAARCRTVRVNATLTTLVYKSDTNWSVGSMRNLAADDMRWIVVLVSMVCFLGTIRLTDLMEWRASQPSITISR